MTDLGEQLARQLVGPFGRFELLPHAMEPAKSEQRLTPRARTSAFVGQLDGLLDQALGLVQLEPDDVRLGQRLRGDGLEILAAGRERDGECLLHVRNGLGHRATRTGDADSHDERVEVGVDVRLVLLQLERAVDELLRARRCFRSASDTASPSTVSASASISASPCASASARTFSISTDTAVRSPSLQTARAA